MPSLAAKQPSVGVSMPSFRIDALSPGIAMTDLWVAGRAGHFYGRARGRSSGGAGRVPCLPWQKMAGLRVEKKAAGA